MEKIELMYPEAEIASFIENSNIIYFELNNWFSGRDYPSAEPFYTWCGNDLNLYFLNEEWVKKNRLCVNCCNIDMSVNWCITAKKQWVIENCPALLTNEILKATFSVTSKDGIHEKDEYCSYYQFLRIPDEFGDVYGRFGTEFKKYSDDNIGITWGPDPYDDDDYEDYLDDNNE